LFLFIKKYGDQQNPEAMRYIKKAEESTNRMKSLIQDLLEYSRISTRANEFEPISLAEILQRVIENLNHIIGESKTSIDYTELPEVYGDFSQVVQLFQNIIQNAIKYRGEPNPEIIIRAETKERFVQISIADNGIGIEPEYQLRIFEIFKRLHTREEFPGNGVGLSICKKIVERHQGKIWCESIQSGGTSFFFTLPLPPEKN
jgi:light-regulated signal transduction histidine kinase (bacteriophytochrome)